MTFRAILLQQDADGRTMADVRDVDEQSLPSEGGVTVDVAYSTINYKDALAITGSAPVVRRFPMVPGIDLAGTVVESDSPKWKSGDEVLVTGCGLGEEYWGGLSERARVKAEWLVRRPERLTLYDTMAVGTAGFTAALCLLAFEAQRVGPSDGEVLVTGATGGVGSIAVMLLAASGYRVVASTGKLDEAPYLRALGARDVIDRSTLSKAGKPLQKERWAAAIDTVGSHTLANVCASMKAHGTVAACGLAQGMDFPATVAPFILRGVTLVGIHSVFVPMDTRRLAWERIERLVDVSKLRELSEDIGLTDALDAAPRLLRGQMKGRLVVDTHRLRRPG